MLCSARDGLVFSGGGLPYKKILTFLLFSVNDFVCVLFLLPW